jgi:hypothetical protein
MSTDGGRPNARRWNTLAADSLGVHLQLMPMLLGFLTYKGAVIARGRVSVCVSCMQQTSAQSEHLRLTAPVPSPMFNIQPALVRCCAPEVSGEMADIQPASGAGALDLFADLSGSSGSQAAQAAAEAAAQSTAANAEGGVPLHLVVKCVMPLLALFGCRYAVQILGCLRCYHSSLFCQPAGQLQPGQRQQGQADDLLVGRDYASRVLQG